MIQRIQTVYILLFCIVIFAASFSPFATIITLENSTYTLLPTGWESQSSLAEFNTYPFFTSYLVSISFAILMLVNYKKRVKQLRYGKLCYFFTLLSFVVMFLEFNNALEIIKSENGLEKANFVQYDIENLCQLARTANKQIEEYWELYWVTNYLKYIVVIHIEIFFYIFSIVLPRKIFICICDMILFDIL